MEKLENKQPPPTSLPEVRLDWRAYFEKFCEVHGGNPVPFEGRLLFPDGWMYSSTDYSGPEWPPDHRRLAFCIRVYWETRRKMVARQIQELSYILSGLNEIQCRKSLPLQQISTYRDDKGFLRQKPESIDLDIRSMQEKLEWLKEDLLVCNANLRDQHDDTPTAAVS